MPGNLEDFYRACFRDVAEANRDHVQLGTMFVDLNPYGGNYDFALACRIAKEVLILETSIETIYFAEKAN